LNFSHLCSSTVKAKGERVFPFAFLDLRSDSAQYRQCSDLQGYSTSTPALLLCSIVQAALIGLIGGCSSPR